MGLGLVENLFRRACAVEFFQHLTAPGIFDAAVDLAIGKRACAAFAETVERIANRPIER